MLEPDGLWNESPSRYLREVRAAFKRHPTYRGMVQKKNRCVRIDYANDCHVDVVPYLLVPDGRQVIVNYAEDEFEDTNPAGFTAWMRERDELAGGNLRKVIRLTKYLRDYKNTFSCPSVILTTLLGDVVQAYDTTGRYGDVATAFINLLTDLDEWLDLWPNMPDLEDPSCPGTSFNHRWTEAQYQTFKTSIARYAGWARAALGEQDNDLALAAWQELFGSAFTKPSVVATLTAALASTSLTRTVGGAVQERAPREQLIEEQNLTFASRYTARIDASVVPKNGFRDVNLRAMRQVPKHRTIKFRLVTDAPEPYRVLWKVRNRGDEAERLGQLRGELIRDDGTRRRTERTQYSGQHFVEAYVVKGNTVVASDHHEVNIP